jgi:hypothetical protein
MLAPFPLHYLTIVQNRTIDCYCSSFVEQVLEQLLEAIGHSKTVLLTLDCRPMSRLIQESLF